MKIKYTPASISDIQSSSDYIRDNLKNPKAAVFLKTTIVRSIALLKDNPYMGTPLSSKLDGLDTGIRFFVVSKQLVFYEIISEHIDIIRVLDSRTDYLATLLISKECALLSEVGYSDS